MNLWSWYRELFLEIQRFQNTEGNAFRITSTILGVGDLNRQVPGPNQILTFLANQKCSEAFPGNLKMETKQTLNNSRGHHSTHILSFSCPDTIFQGATHTDTHTPLKQAISLKGYVINPAVTAESAAV